MISCSQLSPGQAQLQEIVKTTYDYLFIYSEKMKGKTLYREVVQ